MATLFQKCDHTMMFALVDSIGLDQGEGGGTQTFSQIKNVPPPPFSYRFIDSPKNFRLYAQRFEILCVFKFSFYDSNFLSYGPKTKKTRFFRILYLNFLANGLDGHFGRETSIYLLTDTYTDRQRTRIDIRNYSPPLGRRRKSVKQRNTVVEVCKKVCKNQWLWLQDSSGACSFWAQL